MNLLNWMPFPREKRYHHGHKAYHKKISIQCIVSGIFHCSQCVRCSKPMNFINFVVVLEYIYRVGRTVTSWFNIGNQKAVRPGISVGRRRSTWNDPRQISQHIPKSKEMNNNNNWCVVTSKTVHRFIGISKNRWRNETFIYFLLEMKYRLNHIDSHDNINKGKRVISIGCCHRIISKGIRCNCHCKRNKWKKTLNREIVFASGLFSFLLVFCYLFGIVEFLRTGFEHKIMSSAELYELHISEGTHGRFCFFFRFVNDRNVE